MCLQTRNILAVTTSALFFMLPLVAQAQGDQTAEDLDRFFRKGDSSATFETNKWTDRANFAQRKFMLYDLVDTFLLMGITRKQLHSMLGHPNEARAESDIYWLHADPSYIVRGTLPIVIPAHKEKTNGLRIEFVFNNDALSKYRVCKDQQEGSWHSQSECPGGIQLPLRGVRTVRLQVHLTENPGGDDVPLQKILLPRLKEKIEEMGIKVAQTNDPQLPLVCFNATYNNSPPRDANELECSPEMRVYEPIVPTKKLFVTWISGLKTGGDRYAIEQTIQNGFQWLMQEFRKNWRKNNGLPPEEEIQNENQNLDLAFEKHVPFDSGAWKGAVNGVLREQMLYDLISSQKLFGMSRDKVHGLLGQPAQDALSQKGLRSEMETYMCAPRRYFDILYGGSNVARIKYRVVFANAFPTLSRSSEWFGGIEQTRR
jgi:hypothetical protein